MDSFVNFNFFRLDFLPFIGCLTIVIVNSLDSDHMDSGPDGKLKKEDTLVFIIIIILFIYIHIEHKVLPQI